MANTVKVVIAGENIAGPAFSQAEKQLQGLEAAAGRFAQVLAGLGGALVIAKIGEMVKSAAEAAHGFELLSEKTGIGVVALQDLSYAAKLSGSDTEALEKGLRFLSRNMVDAAAGVAKPAAAFKALGVSVTDAGGKMLPVETVFRKLADAFQAMPAGANKAAESIAIFGRSGTKMIPLLDQGSSGLDQYTARFRALGSELDEKTIASLANIAKTMADLDKMTEGLALQFTAGLAPGLQSALNAFLDVKGGMAAAIEVGKALGEVMAVAAAGIISTISGLQIMWLEMEKFARYAADSGIMAGQGAAGAGGGVIPQINDEIDALLRKHEHLMAVLAGTEKPVLPPAPPKKTGTSDTDFAAALRGPAALPLHTPAEIGAFKTWDVLEANKAWAMNLTMMGLDQKGWQELLPMLTAGSEAFKAQDKTLNDAAAAMTEESRTIEENYQLRLQQIAVLEELGKITVDVANREREAAKEARDAADGTLQAQKKALHELEQEFKQFGRALGDTFEEAVINMDFGLNTLISVLREVEHAILRAFVTKPLEDWFGVLAKNAGSAGGFFNSLLRAFGMGGGGGASAGQVVGFGPGDWTGTFASGGDYSAGWRVVGENGPELDFVGHQGRVVSNPEIRNAIGGGAGYVDNRVYNVDARGSTMSRAEFVQVLAATESRAVARSLNAIAQINRRV